MNSLRLILRFLAVQGIIAYGVIFLTLEVVQPDSSFNKPKPDMPADTDESQPSIPRRSDDVALVKRELGRLRPLMPGVMILGCGLLLQFLVVISVSGKRGQGLPYAPANSSAPRTIPYPNTSKE